MFVVVLLLAILIPVAELIVMFKVADAFGWLETLSVLVLVSVVGAWLVRRQGLTIVMRIQRELTEGNVPTKTVVDGLLLLVAGVLLLTPGFVTDAAAILLVFPPTRIALRGLLIRRYRSRLDFYKGRATSAGGLWSRVVISDDVIDTEGRENRPRRDPSGELEP
ncbi:MAG TPA: FxsA family protein [Acidimicrobiales bacterium]|nr:FxsA family protein [Acidimicrobiales bacterium]